MSNTGQAVLTVVGTVVGAYFGYPQLGFALGSLAGQALFPTKLPGISGPRLADLGQTQSSVGAPIPRGWGTVPATGNIIAKSDIREVIETDELGGKGGPTQKVETPTYYQDFAIGINDGLIAGVRRIWANGKLIYDRRSQQEGETDAAFTARMGANAALDEILTVYLGTEDQMPDPTLEAFYGVGEISAFRGLAYLVFANWFNKPEDGGKMPLSWRIEYFTVANSDSTDLTEYSNEVLFPWLATGHPVNPLNAHAFTIVADGNHFTPDNTPVASIAEGLAILSGVRGRTMDIFQGTAATAAGLGGLHHGRLDTMTLNGGQGVSAATSDRPDIWLHYNSVDSTAEAYWAPAGLPGPSYCYRFASYLEIGDTVLTTDGYTLEGLFTDTGNAIYLMLPPSALAAPEGYDQFNSECSFLGFVWAQSIGVAIQAVRVPRAPDDPCHPLVGTTPPRLPGSEGYCIVNGTVKKAGPWELVSGSFVAMSVYSASIPIVYPRNPLRPVSHADNNQAFWEEEYRISTAVGEMPLGLVYGVDYPKAQAFGYTRPATATAFDHIPVSLAEIVRDLHREAGYSDSDFDVSDLEDTTVIGFVRTGPMAARGAVEALRPVGMFDQCEDEGVLKYVRRGKDIVATISDEDLGATITGQDGVSRITTRKMMDYDVPRQVRLHYLSYERDYDAGEAQSPVRTDTDAVQTVDLDTTVVMEDEQAAQVVQIIWADLWASKWGHTIQLDMSSQVYKTTDTLAVPVDGVYQRMRIGAITDKLPSVRAIELVRDSGSNFTSYAVPSVPPIDNTTVTVIAPAEMIILDIPLLRDEDNNAGVYAGIRGLISGVTFRGAVVLRSLDGGNYQRIAQAASDAYIGTTLSSLGDVDPSVVDYSTSILVDLFNGTLESRTLDEILAGSNAAAIGADGRWEIVQFLNVEQIDSTTYSLSGFLRGRRGTEHAVGSGVAGDRFVLISGPGIIRLPLDIAALNKEMLYKCVATGTAIDDIDAQPFTGHGIALKPFSPVDITGSRDLADGSWTIRWIRRGRIGQTLQTGVDVPLSEETEDYEVAIMNGVVEARVISVSAESCVYTGDQQRTDFASYVDTLVVNIYQNSASVGRGYVGEATLQAEGGILGDPVSALFAPDAADNPLTLLVTDTVFLLARTGMKGAAPCVGIYSHVGTGTATLIGDTYDGRYGSDGSHVPVQYGRNLHRGLLDNYPTTASRSDTDAYAIFWKRRPVGTSNDGQKFLLTGLDVVAAPNSLAPSNLVNNGVDILAIYRSTTTFYALVAGSPPAVYTSTDGETWASAGATSGLPNLSFGDQVKLFQFNDDVYALTTLGLYVNAASNLSAWIAVPLFPSAFYSSVTYKDAAVNGANLCVLLEGTLVSDGLVYNIVVVHSTGSPTYDMSRNVVKSTDLAPSFAFNLEWDIVVPLSTGFCIYGKNPSSGSFPYVLKSTDGGHTWAAAAVVDVGDVTNNSIIMNAISNGARLVACDTNRTVGPLTHYTRFSTSTDGITFTALTM